MRSTLLPGQPWDVMVDLFFYREPEETKEPGEEDPADYNNQEGYGQLPAPGGQNLMPSTCLNHQAYVPRAGAACHQADSLLFNAAN